MSTIDKITDAFPDETFLKADGFDEAIIGVDYNSRRLIYSVSKCIDILAEQFEADSDDPYTEAIEFLEFNTFSAYVGEQTPIWCEDRI